MTTVGLAIASAQSEDQTVWLGVGEVHEVRIHPVQSVSVSSSRILSARLEGKRSLILRGKAAGEASVIARSADSLPQKLRVVVLATRDQSTVRPLLQAVEERPGLEVAWDSDPSDRNRSSLQVKGRLLRWSDWRALADVSPKDRLAYRMRADLGVGPSRLLKEEVARLAAESGCQAEVNLMDRSLGVEDSWCQQQWRSFANQFGLVLQDEPSTSPPLVVQFWLAESALSDSESIGLSPPSSLGWAGELGGPGRWSALQAQLFALASSGESKRTLRPRLPVRVDETSEMDVGGEVPVLASGSKSGRPTLEWKPIGLALRAKPRRIGARRYRLDLQLSHSETSGATANGWPTLSQARVKLSVDLVPNQVVSLGTLAINRAGTGRSGLLRSLLTAKDTQTMRSGLSIFARLENDRLESELE